MGSGEVGVDPARLARAAAALGQLRDALAANVPVIVGTMNEYWQDGTGTPVSLAALKRAQAQSVQDATQMETRARLAELWQQQDVNINAHGLVEIPWSGTALDDADARAEARALAAAEASGNVKSARAAIKAIEADVADHLGDSPDDVAWRNAFYSDAAPAVAKLASTLHAEDGSGLQILSADDKQILSTFARGLAATTASGGLSEAGLKALTQARDIWSAAMLLSLGPSGPAYGTGQGAQLLGGVTAALLNAERSGALVIPASGIPGDTRRNGVKVNDALAEYDPTLALLRLDTANGMAASYTLAGPDGKAIATQLMTMQFEYYSLPEPGYGPDGFTAYSNNTGPEGLWDGYLVRWPPQTIGSFLDAATAASRTGPGAQVAAQAARNIIDGTPAPVGADSVTLPEPVRQALMNTYGRYLPDLAASLADPGAEPVFSSGGGTYSISVSDGALAAFLQQICANHADYVKIAGVAGTGIGTAAAMRIAGQKVPGVSNPVDAFAQLYGYIGRQASAIGISKAEQQDMRNQVLNTMIAMAETGFGMVPAGHVLTAAQDLLSLTTPVIPQFPTDLAAQAEQAAHIQAHNQKILAMVPFVRGLEKAGVKLPVPPPAGSFAADGAPTAAFFTWWRDTGAGEVIHDAPDRSNNSLGDIPGGWVPQIQQMMGFGDGPAGG